MADNDINPYAAPNPIETQKQLAQARPRSQDKRMWEASVFWWVYFALCCLLYAQDLRETAHIVMSYHTWRFLYGPSFLSALVEGFAALGLLCYIRKVPFLHSFVWGLVCLAYLGMSIYAPAKIISFLNDHDASLVSPPFLWFMVVRLLRLPQLYALWRYSSSSSPTWREPRIQWKALLRKLVDAILYLRRA